MLLLTLATRACLAVGGLSAGHLLEPVNSNSSLVSSNSSRLHDAKEPLLMSSNPNGLSVLNPLAPQWQLLTEPGAWLEATIQVKKPLLTKPHPAGGALPSIGNRGLHSILQLLPAAAQHGLTCLTLLQTVLRV